MATPPFCTMPCVKSRALACQFDFLRKYHRQVVVRNRYDSVLCAIHHWNWRAPTSLPRDAPVLQPKDRLGAPESFLFRERGHLPDGREALHPAIRPGIYANSILRERLFHGLLA